MARINGVDLPREKRVEIGLTYIYGIGRTTATKICVECNVNVDTRVKDLTAVSATRTSSALWTSAATAAFVTARASRSAASAPTLTLVPARARSVRSVLRRRNKER